MLLFKKAYWDAIRAGTKTSTLRYWRRPMVRPGQLHTVRGLGTLRILAVRVLAPGALTEVDARSDGFDSLADLRAALEGHYPPDDRADRKLYQIHFTLVDDAACKAPAAGSGSAAPPRSRPSLPGGRSSQSGR